MLAFGTGGTGFVGSNLMAALIKRGIGVRVLSSAGIYVDGSKARTELGVPFTPSRTAAQSVYGWYLGNHYLPNQAAIPQARMRR